MPKFKVITATRTFLNGVFVAEAIGTFELSATGAGKPEAIELLTRKLKEFFSEEELAGTLGLHRRCIGEPIKSGRIDMRLEAPSRSAGWRDAVRVPVDYVQWTESEDLHVAYAPQFQVMVFAPKPDDLERRLEKNVRLVLARLGKDLNLIDLSRAETVESIELGAEVFEAARKSPKQIAVGQERETDEVATLNKVAQRLDEEKEQAAFEMEDELHSLAEALQPETRRSVLLVGPGGSGKTALAHEFVRRRGDFMFGATEFWSTSGSRLMTGPIGYGLWQERCQEMCRELTRTNGILHAGNLGELVEVGKARRSEQSVGGFLRPWIARGEIQVIAEVTPEQLARIEREHPQLVTAFQQVTIRPRSSEQTARILEALWNAAPGERPSGAETRESHAALAWLRSLHERYGVYSARPGRPVRFLRNLLIDIFPRKAFSEADVTERFSRETGLPAVFLDDRVPLDLQETEQCFSLRVIGQNEAVRRVVDLIATVKARLARPGKPLASLLFIGPTGVGKTEMAKTLAEFFFGSAGRLARFDLNQFNDPVSVQRLIGASGGGEGLLTARIREQPFSVVLLDEFEKADPAFFDLLLQMLGEGRLTDASGRLADFSNCVVVMTSNLGAERLQRGAPGFAAEASNAKEHFEDAVSKFLRPEIFNRIDAIVPFQSLAPAIIRQIAERYIVAIRHRHGLTQRGIDLRVEQGVVEHLARIGLDPKYGARPLKRAVERELMVPVAEWLGENRKARDLAIRAGRKNNSFVVWKQAGTESAEAGIQSGVGTMGADVVRLRRAVGRLKKSGAFASLENQVTLLRDLEARLKKAKYKSPEDLGRIGRLPEISRVVGEVTQLESNVHALETEVLSSIFLKREGEAERWRAALERFRAERRSLQYKVYEASLEQSEEVILAIFSEDKALLIELVQAYRILAERGGRITELHYFSPATRSKGTKEAVAFTREKSNESKKFFEEPPSPLLGVAMKMNGNLFAPKFLDEAGLHRFIGEKSTRLALLETATGKMDEYHPPEGFELQGFIHSKTAPVRRTFMQVENRVKDSVLGELPWMGPGIERSVAQMLDDALDRKVMAATGGDEERR